MAGYVSLDMTENSTPDAVTPLLGRRKPEKQLAITRLVGLAAITVSVLTLLYVAHIQKQISATATATTFPNAVSPPAGNPSDSLRDFIKEEGRGRANWGGQNDDEAMPMVVPNLKVNLDSPPSSSTTEKTLLDIQRLHELENGIDRDADKPEVNGDQDEGTGEAFVPIATFATCTCDSCEAQCPLGQAACCWRDLGKHCHCTCSNSCDTSPM